MTAAATLYVLGGESDGTYLQEAESTIDTAIADQQASNGSFVPPSTDSTSVGTTTAWFAAEEGTVYHLLSPYLAASTKAAWQTSIAAAAKWLVTDGDTVWYANGNINSVYVEVEWLAYQATGQSQFLTDYNQAWSTLMDPNQTKFPGSGWVTTVAPTQADGSDGSGYFTESGAGGTGWDPYYSMLQMDAMARLYLVSGDPRALQAANMLWNQESSRLNTTNWMLNQSDGTRHTGAEGATGFLDADMFVLALDGNRTSLLSSLMPFLNTYESWYPQPNQADGASFRRAFGNSLSTIALAAALADPSQQSEVSGYGLLGSNASTYTAVGTSQTPANTPVSASASPTTTTATTPTNTTTTTPTTTTAATPTSTTPTGPSSSTPAPTTTSTATTGIATSSPTSEAPATKATPTKAGPTKATGPNAAAVKAQNALRRQQAAKARRAAAARKAAEGRKLLRGRRTSASR